MASYDSKGQLLCGAAVNTRETSKKTIEMLVEAGADVIVIVSECYNYCCAIGIL